MTGKQFKKQRFCHRKKKIFCFSDGLVKRIARVVQQIPEHLQVKAGIHFLKHDTVKITPAYLATFRSRNHLKTTFLRF